MEQWAVDIAAPGSSWGFGALLKGLTSVVDNSFLPEPRFEPTTLGYLGALVQNSAQFSALFGRQGPKNGICGIKTIVWQHHDTIRVNILCIQQQIHSRTMQIEKHPKSCNTEKLIFSRRFPPDGWGCVGEGGWNAESNAVSNAVRGYIAGRFVLMLCFLHSLYLSVLLPFFSIFRSVAGRRAGKGRW